MTPHAPQNNGWMDPDPKGMWFHADEVESLEAGLAKLEADLAAANATLDRLRELLPEGGVWCYACNRATVPIWGEEPYEHIDPKYKQMKTTFRCSICKRETHAKDSCVDTVRAILYPTPDRRSLREIADANGFAPIPAESAQRNIDGETNFVAMPTPENDNEN